ncbi:hypothetical protein [Xylophilus sp. Leaf220]|uniref:hypothetical protein n=1 Tax=Xylophilus sp. Leaf220 TaxID=1735686 RepID=UPI0006F66FD3|nr:hypothetical protein [Xylophilus sp. Leaf220]KQM79501.1 hypothetical protein ASE76_15675 [Xylophilus sp. Leaf220]
MSARRAPALQRLAGRALAAALLCAALAGCNVVSGGGSRTAGDPNAAGTGGSGMTVFGTVDAAVTRSR